MTLSDQRGGGYVEGGREGGREQAIRVEVAVLVVLVNSNDAIWRHDLCELSISLWEFIWGV